MDGRITGWLKRRLALLLAHGISLYAYHLPLDAHPELGNNAQLGLHLGLAADGASASSDLGFVGRREAPLAASASSPRASPSGCGARRWSLPATAGSCRASPGAPAARRATSRPPSPPAPMPTSPARSPSRRRTWRARPAWPIFACGHHATERYGAPALAAHVAAQFGIEHEFIDIDNPA